MATTMIECEACHVQISKQAEKCPQCGHPNKKFKKPVGCLKIIGYTFLAFILIIAIIVANQTPEERAASAAAHQQKQVNNQATKEAQKEQKATAPEILKETSLLEKAESAMADVGMSGAYTKVINDSIDQYNITKRGDNKIEVCVHAGMVSAAFLQAKDEAGYKKWKAIEKNDCKKAGMPEL
ncbi:MAG: hypothetical protein WCK96_10885 [Methylococcales bacterium]